MFFISFGKHSFLKTEFRYYFWYVLKNIFCFLNIRLFMLTWRSNKLQILKIFKALNYYYFNCIITFNKSHPALYYLVFSVICCIGEEQPDYVNENCYFVCEISLVEKDLLRLKVITVKPELTTTSEKRLPAYSGHYFIVLI